MENRQKTVRIIRIVLLAPVLLGMLTVAAACLNPVSVDNCGYVVAIGADLGKSKAYDITLELQRESAGEATENSGGALILSVEADDIFSAIDTLSSGIAYKLNFTRTHIFIFGEELARKGRISDFLEMSFDVLRIRKSALMIVSKAPVRDYIGGLVSNNNANIAKMQDALISNVERTGEISAVNISLFYEAVDEGRFDAVMPIGRYDSEIITDTKQYDATKKGENPIKDAKNASRIGGMQSLTEGSALFSGAAMVGTLSGYETQFMNIVRGDFKEGSIFVEYDGKHASVFAIKNKRSIKIVNSGDNYAAKVFIKLNITVERDPAAELGKRFYSGAGSALERFFERELKKVFIKCRDLGSDAMGFGRYVSMLFKSTEALEAFDWKEAYKTFDVDFTVELTLDDGYLADDGQ